MNLRNTTKRPLTVSLPGGKKLRLGPGKTGQVSPKAEDHPPLKKLLDAGEIEILEGGRTSSTGGVHDGTGPASPRGPGAAGGVRHTGDR